MVLFITVSSLPRALRALWTWSASLNDQMWPGPWSQCQVRTGGQPQPVGIPHTYQRGIDTEWGEGKTWSCWWWWWCVWERGLCECVEGCWEHKWKKPMRLDDASGNHTLCTRIMEEKGQVYMESNKRAGTKKYNQIAAKRPRQNGKPSVSVIL